MIPFGIPSARWKRNREAGGVHCSLSTKQSWCSSGCMSRPKTRLPSGVENRPGPFRVLIRDPRKPTSRSGSGGLASRMHGHLCKHRLGCLPSTAARPKGDQLQHCVSYCLNPRAKSRAEQHFAVRLSSVIRLAQLASLKARVRSIKGSSHICLSVILVVECTTHPYGHEGRRLRSTG